jgi:hypothetical protein
MHILVFYHLKIDELGSIFVFYHSKNHAKKALIAWIDIRKYVSHAPIC